MLGSQPSRCSLEHTHGTREEAIRDRRSQRISAKEWKGLVTTCSPAGPANHSQLSAQEEGALVSGELEKRQKECEQTLSSMG